MPLTSDLTLNTAKFAPSSVTVETDKFNDQLMAIMAKGPFWYEVGAVKYRTMRWNGETPLPKPIVLDSGKNMSIPSREQGREIPARVFVPEEGKEVKGGYMHIHGGGWVLQSEE
jgi:acetyl esterase/lipase